MKSQQAEKRIEDANGMITSRREGMLEIVNETIAYHMINGGVKR